MRHVLSYLPNLAHGIDPAPVPPAQRLHFNALCVDVREDLCLGEWMPTLGNKEVGSYTEVQMRDTTRTSEATLATAFDWHSLNLILG